MLIILQQFIQLTSGLDTGLANNSFFVHTMSMGHHDKPTNFCQAYVLQEVDVQKFLCCTIASSGTGLHDW